MYQPRATDYEYYLAGLEQELTATIDKLTAMTDPIEKEKRIFPVKPAPVFLHTLAKLVDMPALQPFSVPDIKSTLLGQHQSIRDSLEENHSKNYTSMLQPFKWMECGSAVTEGSVSVIPVKVSQHTMVKGQPLQALVRKVVNGSIVESHCIIPTLRDVVLTSRPELGRILGWDVDSVSHPHPFSLNLLTAICQLNSGEFLPTAVIADLRQKWPESGTTPLRMKTKLYVSRADVRAYYVDPDPLRHLVGSILQTHLVPFRREVAMAFHTQAWYPVMHRNLINRRVENPPGRSISVAVGDVSSFTASDINAWVYELIVYLSCFSPGNEWLDRTIVYSVGTILVEALLSDVLLLYLYTTVGAQARLPDGSVHRTTGGYLGVKANMSFTTLGFAIRLESAKQAARMIWPGVTLSGQIGGDDFFLCCSSLNPSDVKDVLFWLQTYIRTYVGSVKEFVEVNDVQLLSHEYDLPVRFCKKRLRLRKQESPYERSVSITSVEKLPIMTQVISRDIKAPKRRPAREAYRFWTQLNRYFAQWGEGEVYVWSYYEEFLAVWRMGGSEAWGHKQVMLWSTAVYSLDDTTAVTFSSLSTSIPPFPRCTKGGSVANISPVQQLRMLAAEKRLEKTKVVDDVGNTLTLFHRPSEYHNLPFTQDHDRLWYGETSVVSVEFKRIIRKFRSELDEIIELLSDRGYCEKDVEVFVLSDDN